MGTAGPPRGLDKVAADVLLRWFLFSIVLFATAAPQAAQAQAIRLDVQARPLAEALRLLREQADIDLVYTERLVTPHTVTCRYVGSDAAEALACLLRDTGLRAVPGRARQYVLTAASPSDTEARPPPSRSRVTVAGFVVDATTGEALPGAHIYLSSERRGTISNEAGYFALPAVRGGAQRLRVSYLGYGVLDTTLVPTRTVVMLPLAAATFQSSGIVVEAAGRDHIAMTVVPGVVAVPVQELESLPLSIGGQDLFQALQWMPGVQQSGEVRGGLIVRGSGDDQNLYLLDGAPVYHPWHAFSFISTFQTETFKDIRLYRGAFPAEYGGRLSAVLDAELRDGGRRPQPRAVAALNPLSGRFLIESPIRGENSFMLSGRGSYLDKIIGYEHPVVDETGRRDTLRTGYYFYDWSGKVSLKTSRRGRLSLSYYDGQDVLDLRLPFDLSLDFSSWLRPADLFFEVEQHWGNRLFSARYQFLQSDRFFTTTTIYASNYDAREATFIQPTTSASVASDYTVKLLDLGVRFDADYFLTLAHQIRAGVHLVQHRFRSTLDAMLERSPGAVDLVTQRSRIESLELAGYVQDTWKPNVFWTVQPGVRLSYFSSGRYASVDPRLSIRYAIDPRRLVFRGAVGTQVQYMQRVRDRYSFLYDLVSSRWIPSSSGVHPSRGFQANLGVEGYPLPWLSLTVEGYGRWANDILLPEDEFQTKDGLEGPGIEVGNLLGTFTSGKARAYGVEVGVEAQYRRWHLLLSYTGGRSLNRAPQLGEDRMRPSRFDVPRSLRSVLGWQYSRWRLGAAVVWRSGYPETVPVARYALGSPLDDEPVRYLYRPQINNGRLPPYFRLDLSVDYRFAWLGARWWLRLQLYNALNRGNVVGRTYDPELPQVRGADRNELPLLPLFEVQMEL